MNTSRRVLVVDDDADQLQTLCRGLRVLGIEALTARSAAEAEVKLDEGHIELVVADVTRPGKPGEVLIARRPGLAVLLLTGLALTPKARELKARGASLLTKPFGPDELRRAIDEVCRGQIATR
jgi:DNA-binding response OmpR family regulator